MARGVGGGGWHALPPRGQKNIRRRPSWAALQARQAGAHSEDGEEVRAFRPPSRRPSGESPPTPARRRGRIGGTGGSGGEIWGPEPRGAARRG